MSAPTQHPSLPLRFLPALSHRFSLALVPVITLVVLLGSGCGGTTSGNPGTESLVEDTSASGAAAGAIGGSLSSSGTNGGSLAWLDQGPVRLLNLFAEAWAASACPTFRTANGSGCTGNGSGDLWLTYTGCSFGASKSTWSGYQLLSRSTGTATCGHAPAPVDSGTLYVQYVKGASGANATTPYFVTQTNAFGTSIKIDDSSPNLGNFPDNTVSAPLNGGYGSTVTYDGTGARTELTLGHQVVTGASNYSVVTGTPISITETAGTTTRTASGSITVYHNLLNVIGTATFTALVHTDGCCLPTSGTISTAFSAGSTSPTTAGSLMVGKKETLTITGCGTGILEAFDGTTSDVSLTKCY